MALMVQQLLKGMVKKYPAARFLADTLDVKVIDPPQAWGKPSALNHTHLTLKTVMILVLATVQRLSDLNLLQKTPKAMQITEDSVIFQPVFGAKNARPKHLYRPTITLRQAEDECLCLMRLIKEYIAKPKIGRTEASSL